MDKHRHLLRMHIVVPILAILMALFASIAGATTVSIQPGETLGDVASRYGTTARALAQANGLADPDLVIAGTRLVISGNSGRVTSGGGSGGHVVQAGENLGSIAARYGTSASALARANGISNANLVVAGTRLRVNGGSASSSGASSSSGGGHVVQAGENLGSIAARYGTSASALAQANGISNPNFVVVGTRLRVSGTRSGTASATSGGGSGGYVVQAGENLGSIAARYGTSASALAQVNNIANPNMVVVGTRLRISGAVSSTTTTTTSSNGMSQGPLTPVTAARSGWGSQPSRSEVSSLMVTYANRHGVDPSLVRAIGWQESGWWQGARSSTGAIGVMQLMPGTASWLGPALLGRQLNPYNVRDNIEGGAAYLAYLQRQTGSRRLAIASYYQGLGSVSSRGLYGETESYVASVSSFIGRV